MLVWLENPGVFETWVRLRVYPNPKRLKGSPRLRGSHRPIPSDGFRGAR